MATLITKNSSTAAAVPGTGDLVQGELAVNVTDKKLYTKDSGGNIVKVVGSLGNQEANAVAITGGTISGVAGLVATNYQEFTSSGTWTKPANVNFVYVEAIGGGGSGGCDNSVGASGGGGGLFVSRVFRASDLTSTVAVTVGAGGAARSPSNPGLSGAASTFGSYLSAPGGGGGAVNGSNTGGLAGGIYGISLNRNGIEGGTGGSTAIVGGNSIYGGAGGGAIEGSGLSYAGGTSQFGGNGGTGGSPGVAGSVPGGGGGGGQASSGAGGNGRVRVWTW